VNCIFGNKTIDVLDLNRIRKNNNKIIDNLPNKRGDILFSFKKELEKYNFLKTILTQNRSTLAELPSDVNLQKLIDERDSNINEKRESIKKRFLSKSAEFSGMCRYWLKYDTDVENDFIEVDV